MKKIISILPLLLFACILSQALLSCNNGGAANNSGETTAAGGDPGEKAPEEEIEEFEPIDGLDYGGYKFRMLGFESTSGDWKSVSYSEIYAEEETGDPINDSVYKRNRIVENLYNINIELVPVSYKDRHEVGTRALKPILAGDDLYDIGMIVGICLPTLLNKADALIDLKTISGLDFSKSWWDQNSVKDLSIGGKLYAAVGDMSLYTQTATIVMYANKGLIHEYSLDDPYKLVRDGKWTWDKLSEMCKAVVKDLNGDGTINEYDQLGLLAEIPSLMLGLRSTGAKYVTKDKDDLPVLTLMNDRTAMAVEKISSIINDTDANISINSITSQQNAFHTVAMPKFRDNEALFFYNQLLIALELRDMSADFAILPAPMLDESQDKYYSNVSEFFVTYTCVPQTNTDHERTANIVEAMNHYSRKYVNPAFYDLTVTNKLVRDEESLEMLDILMNNRSFDLGITFNWGDMESMLNPIIANRKNTFASIYESAERRISTAMEKTLANLDLQR